MCRIDTLFIPYLENIQYCFTECNVTQKLKGTNWAGVASWKVFGQNKIKTVAEKKLEMYTW